MYLHQHLHGKHHMKAYELATKNMNASSYSFCDSIYPYRINMLILHVAKIMFKKYKMISFTNMDTNQTYLIMAHNLFP
jgi:hypothetical protein